MPSELACLIERRFAESQLMGPKCRLGDIVDEILNASSRPPGLGEIDRLALEGHVDALKDELAMEREAHQSALARCRELRDCLQESRSIMDRYRDCRRFGVGMLQGTRINLDDEVRAFLARTGGCPVKDFEDISANHSTDPVLANIEQGVRDGLAKSEANRSESDAD